MTAHLDRGPSPRSVGQLEPWRRDGRRLLGERPTPGRALPADLAPHQRRRLPETRQICQLHHIPVLDHHRPIAARTRRPCPSGLDADSEPVTGARDVKDVHPTKTNQQLTHGNRIRRQQGLPNLNGFDTSRFVESLLRAEDPHSLRPRSGAKRQFPRFELGLKGIKIPFAFITLDMYSTSLWTPGTTLTGDIPPCQYGYTKFSSVAGYQLKVLGGLGLEDQYTIWEKQIDVYLDGKECTLSGD